MIFVLNFFRPKQFCNQPIEFEPQLKAKWPTVSKRRLFFFCLFLEVISRNRSWKSVFKQFLLLSSAKPPSLPQVLRNEHMCVCVSFRCHTIFFPLRECVWVRFCMKKLSIEFHVKWRRPLSSPCPACFSLKSADQFVWNLSSLVAWLSFGDVCVCVCRKGGLVVGQLLEKSSSSNLNWNNLENRLFNHLMTFFLLFWYQTL